jgi:hypothetical protein
VAVIDLVAKETKAAAKANSKMAATTERETTVNPFIASRYHPWQTLVRAAMHDLYSAHGADLTCAHLLPEIHHRFDDAAAAEFPSSSSSASKFNFEQCVKFASELFVDLQQHGPTMLDIESPLDERSLLAGIDGAEMIGRGLDAKDRVCDVMAEDVQSVVVIGAADSDSRGSELERISIIASKALPGRPTAVAVRHGG